MRIENKLTDLLKLSYEKLRETAIFTDYFAAIELEQIDEQYYLTNLEKGIGFVFDENQFLKSIHLYSERKDGANNFLGELPKGLQFSDSMEIAHSKMGIEKFAFGGGENVAFFGVTNLWRKYIFEEASFHLEFSQDNSIILMTISRIQ